MNLNSANGNGAATPVNAPEGGPPIIAIVMVILLIVGLIVVVVMATAPTPPVSVTPPPAKGTSPPPVPVQQPPPPKAPVTAQQPLPPKAPVPVQQPPPPKAPVTAQQPPPPKAPVTAQQPPPPKAPVLIGASPASTTGKVVATPVQSVVTTPNQQGGKIAETKSNSSVAENAIKSGATKECFQDDQLYSQTMDACLSCPSGYQINNTAVPKCMEICSQKPGRWGDGGDSCTDLNSDKSKKEPKKTTNVIKNKPVLHWYDSPCSTTDGVLDRKKTQNAAMKTCADDASCNGFTWDGENWYLLKNATPVKATNDYSHCYLVKY